jgi:DNA repair protein RecN (Recombination protein N)
LSETAEAEALLETLARDCAFDPARLEKIEERLFALRAAARKFNSPADRLGTLWASFEARRAGLIDNAAEEKKLKIEAAARRAAFVDAAVLLRDKRGLAAKRLAAAVTKELKPLKLDKALFETEVTPLEESQWGAGGTERVRFLVQTNPGTPMGPLSKIASGGERARFFLALKVVLAQDGEATTLIFDEVDQGVGGAVAAAVGERLARLSKSAQVLLVTHSPQIAARADHHFRIAKAPRRKGESVLVTRIERLETAARREEIARMLSGAEITNEARAAAEKLIGARRAGASG